ncbi:Hypothetical_protein [Hexamita inflata]|uniref:Hypothetical_protein n=1 Tax=Hexamita inflata TaxID=28002 RepID=A0ABP1H6U6_9EUKA
MDQINRFYTNLLVGASQFDLSDSFVAETSMCGKLSASQLSQLAPLYLNSKIEILTQQSVDGLYSLSGLINTVPPHLFFDSFYVQNNQIQLFASTTEQLESGERKKPIYKHTQPKTVYTDVKKPPMRDQKTPRKEPQEVKKNEIEIVITETKPVKKEYYKREYTPRNYKQEEGDRYTDKPPTKNQSFYNKNKSRDSPEPSVKKEVPEPKEKPQSSNRFADLSKK